MNKVLPIVLLAMMTASSLAMAQTTQVNNSGNPGWLPEPEECPKCVPEKVIETVVVTKEVPKPIVIPLPAAKILWRGEWSVGSFYKKGEGVQFDGSSYYCTQNHTSTAIDYPPNPLFWDLIAAEGDIGPQGIQGPAGPVGPQGVQGQVGPTGPQGIQGPAGPVGPQGVQGQVGPTGPQGVQGLKGDTGDTGADGKTVLNGSGAPANTTGTDGDFYIDTSANVLYGPKASGAWPTPGVSLVGPQGPAGTPGTIMLSGAIGGACIGIATDTTPVTCTINLGQPTKSLVVQADSANSSRLTVNLNSYFVGDSNANIAIYGPPGGATSIGVAWIAAPL